jgi:hypothetical protein
VNRVLRKLGCLSSLIYIFWLSSCLQGNQREGQPDPKPTPIDWYKITVQNINEFISKPENKGISTQARQFLEKAKHFIFVEGDAKPWIEWAKLIENHPSEIDSLSPDDGVVGRLSCGEGGGYDIVVIFNKEGTSLFTFVRPGE